MVARNEEKRLTQLRQKGNLIMMSPPERDIKLQRDCCFRKVESQGRQGTDIAASSPVS